MLSEKNGRDSDENKKPGVNGGTACEEKEGRESCKEFEELQEAKDGNGESGSEGSELYSH